MTFINKQNAFTLIELLVTVVIIGILSAIAIPNYMSSVVRGSRSAVQTELVQMAALQEKIYLNKNSYALATAGTTTNIITADYDGKETGGLGVTSGLSKDTKYSFSCASCTDQTFTLLATPDPAKGQKNDGSLSIDQAGRKVWGNTTW